ncbi:MAG: histidine kinase [Desulfobacteraceae bacterium]|nr:histidine kinase [Desulfobacteraceae bacterium]
MNFERLRLLLIAAFMIVSLVPLAALGFKVISQGQVLIEEKASSYLKGLAHGNAVEIKGFMAERLSDISSLSNLICIFGYEREKLASHFEQMKQQYEAYLAFLVLDNNEDQVFSTFHSTLDEALTRRLLVKNHDVREGGVFMFDSGRGRVPALMICSPIGDAARENCGHLCALVDFSRIDNLLGKSNIEVTGEVYLVDETGRFLSASRFGARALKDDISMAEIQGRAQGIYETTDYRGERVLQAYGKLDGFPWYVIADQDMAEILDRIKKLGRDAVLYGILTALIVFCLAFFVSTGIVNILKSKYRYEKELEFQVIQKEKLASLGLLTSGLAHELNTPLANALLYTQIAKEELDAPETERQQVQEQLSTVVDEIRQGSRIIRNLLDFSRHSRHDGHKTDVNETLEKLMKIAGPHCESNGIQVQRQLEKGLPKVNANASTVQAIFTNLVSNAIEAMPDGGSLLLRTRYVNVLKIIKIEVQDTGPGIPKEVRGKIFTPFFTTKKQGRGTGLGLFVSHEMVRKLGGDLKLLSSTSQDAVKTGTLFTVEFPVE